MRIALVVAATLLASCLLATASRTRAQAAGQSLSLPIYCAYSMPDGGSLDTSADGGPDNWSSPAEQIVWYGRLGGSGELRPTLSLDLPQGEQVTLRLKIGGQQRTASVAGAGTAATADFGAFAIPRAGDYAFTLAGVSRSGATYGRPQGLGLAGAPCAGAHFDLERQRGAPSVHLWYQIPQGRRVRWFYNEVTARRDPVASYYMACGFSRGYFGIQVNSPTERRIIFSVWDAGAEPKDRSKVALQNRVQLLAKGAGVFASGFGNEGTGGHSHLVYPWKTGHTYRFLVGALPDGRATVYTAYFYFPERRAWGLIASFRAPMDGGYLRGLYSFNEDFWGANGNLEREAEFGPQWAQTASGEWLDLRSAKFTFTSNGQRERLDRGAGVRGDRFVLWNGGYHTPEGPLAYLAPLGRAQAHGGPPTLPDSTTALRGPARAR